MEDQEKKIKLWQAKNDLILFAFNLENQIIIALGSAYFVSCFPQTSCRLNFLNLFTVILSAAFLVFDVRIGLSFLTIKERPVVVLSAFEKELMKFIILLGFGITIMLLPAFFN